MEDRRQELNRKREKLAQLRQQRLLRNRPGTSGDGKVAGASGSQNIVDEPNAAPSEVGCCTVAYGAKATHSMANMAVWRYRDIECAHSGTTKH